MSRPSMGIHGLGRGVSRTSPLPLGGLQPLYPQLTAILTPACLDDVPLVYHSRRLRRCCGGSSQARFVPGRSWEGRRLWLFGSDMPLPQALWCPASRHWGIAREMPRPVASSCRHRSRALRSAAQALLGGFPQSQSRLVAPLWASGVEPLARAASGA